MGSDHGLAGGGGASEEKTGKSETRRSGVEARGWTFGREPKVGSCCTTCEGAWLKVYHTKCAN
jgi:hypothetical protein